MTNCNKVLGILAFITYLVAAYWAIIIDDYTRATFVMAMATYFAVESRP